jgi:type I restriction enzyme S subunit
MTTHHLLHHFAPITEAPAAVARLRQFVLDLAVRGKLVAQENENSSAFSIIDDTPFPIPAHWQWRKLKDIGETQTGSTPRTSEPECYGGTIPFIKPAAIKDSIVTYDGEGLTELGVKQSTCINAGTILMVCIGGSIGKAALVNRRACFNQQINSLSPYEGINSRFLLFAMQASYFQTQVTETAAQGTLPIISKGKWERLFVPLPPLAEQQRIVAKVDALMTLCDELAAAQTEREARRDRLVAATLHRLTASAADPAPFPERARFYFTHLPRLTTRPEHIHQLRQTILTLAVQGKLVPQDPNDEPASLLFNKLTKVKEHMLATRSMKSSKLLQDYSEADLPYTIPSSWAWVMLGEITDIGTGSTPSRTVHEFWQNGHIPWITSGLTSQTLITEADEFVTTSAVEQHRLKLYKPGTLLVALYGQGKTRGQVATLGIEATVNQACAAVCAINGFEDLQHYLRLLLQKIYEEVRTLSAGGTQPNLNVQKIKEILVPLPPLAEQQRIVARVDELLALCDELAANLDTVTATRRRLLEAALQEALVAA